MNGMMNADLINRTIRFLYEKFDGSEYLTENPERKIYRIEHSFRVANIGRQIAEKEGFDETEIVIACLLHDVSYCERFGEDGWINHGRSAARIARPFLHELGLPEDRIGDICYGIAIHVDDKADFEGEATPFALTVGDADNLDRFDVYRIHETLSSTGFLTKPYDDKVGWTTDFIEGLKKNRNAPHGTRTADLLWEKRLDFCISYYEKLLSQLKNSAGIVDGLQ
ncbi:MAG: HD domain-containing protein [Clostridia bacterium]|nr:HD domain-containing protein [Clostridia bacterium]